MLERHCYLQLVFTEHRLAWPIAAREGMEYTWEGSYLRRDVRGVIPEKCSSYLQRQSHLASSIFLLAESESRHLIGVEKMALGMDYPHQEGRWGMGPGPRPPRLPTGNHRRRKGPLSEEATSRRGECP
jgi:hypothetical protein